MLCFLPRRHDLLRRRGPRNVREYFPAQCGLPKPCIVDGIRENARRLLVLVEPHRVLGFDEIREKLSLELVGLRASDAAPIAYIELVDRDVDAKGQDSGPVENEDALEEA